MISQIVSLSWKSFKRSPAFAQNLGTTIIMGLFGLYFGIIFIAVGAGIPFAFDETDQQAAGPTIVGGYYLYGLLYLLFIRIIFQNFSFPLFRQYALQRIKKSSIYHFVLFRSLWNWMNLIPLLAIVAYLISAAYKEGYNVNVLSTSLAMIGVLYLSNYMAFLLDKYLSFNKIMAGGILAILLGITFLDVKGYIALMPIFQGVYDFLVTSIIYAFIPWVLVGIAYYFSFLFLTNSAYFEDQGVVSDASLLGVRKGLFSRFGKVGSLMELEMKLIMRNKRSRTQMLILLMCLVYPLLLSSDSLPMLLFIAIFTTGGFALTYGQLLLSWNSDHFDLLLTRMGSIRDIFKAKYYLQVMSILLNTCLMVWYGFYKVEYFYLIPIAALFNLGVVTFMYMFLASYNSKKIDANKGAAMNYEGMSIALFLIMIPIFIIPAVLILLGIYFDMEMFGLLAIGVVGLLGLIFHNQLIDACVNLFKKNRYKIGAAFRK